MRKQDTSLLSTVIRLIALLAATPIAFAQEEAQEDKGMAESAAKDTSDQTGTNPINFQRDFRIYDEHLWLDGNQNLATVEFRTPFADGNWQFRIRVPFITSLRADVNGDGIDDIDDSGLGDVNFRLLTAAFFKLKGQSFYLRPTSTVGPDRPSDYGIELGYKFVGW